MPDPAWPASPPEVNYLRLVGAGAGGTATTVASGAAWQAITASSEASCAVSATNTACTAPGFVGVGGAASAASATGLNDALTMLAGWAQERAGIAAAAVCAYQAAISSMIPAAVSIANRTEYAADVAINPSVFGALTPAIIALDTVYFGEHWPNNAAAGAAYGAALAGLTATLAVPPPLPSTASPAAGPVSAAEAAARAAVGDATKASGKLAKRTDTSPESAAQSLVSTLSGLGAPLSAPQQGMFQPATQGLSGLISAAGSGSQRHLDDQGELFDDGPAVPVAGLPASAAPASGGAAPVGAGQIGAQSAAGIGPGLATTYAKPATAFPTASGGRPVGLKGEEPLSARQQGPVTAGAGVAPTPMASRAGLRSDKTGSDMTGSVARARVLLNAERAPSDGSDEGLSNG